MENIKKIVEKQVENYRALRSLSIELLEAIKKGDSSTGTSAVMEKRQKNIELIAEIDPEINKNIEKLGKDDDGIKELRRLLEEIIEIDRQSGEIIQSGKLDVGREMRKLGQMNIAAKGYLGYTETGSGKSKFINIKN